MVHANIALCLREHHVKLIFKKSIQNYANWFSSILLACSLNPHPPSANWSLKIELLPISKCWNQKCTKNKILSRKRPLNNVACFPGALFTNINELQFQHGLVITVIVKCGMKLLINSQILKVAWLKYGNGPVMSYYILQGMWLLIHAGINTLIHIKWQLLGLFNWYHFTCSNLCVPDLQMSCSDFSRMVGYQNSSDSNGGQVTYPIGATY